MTTTEKLQQQYRLLSNEKLIRIATYEVKGLTPEAVGVLKDELETRGLSGYIKKAVALQSQKVDEGEINDLMERLRRCPCPTCGAAHQRLNARIVAQALSFIVMTTYRKKLVIACPSCLKKAVNEATIISAVAGWWGLPWGPIRTVQAMVVNGRVSGTMDAPSEDLQNLVRSQPGAVLAMIEQSEASRLQGAG